MVMLTALLVAFLLLSVANWTPVPFRLPDGVVVSIRLPLLLGLLGMGGLRTFEKIQGVARETLPQKPAPSAIAEGQG